MADCKLQHCHQSLQILRASRIREASPGSSSNSKALILPSCQGPSKLAMPADFAFYFFSQLHALLRLFLPATCSSFLFALSSSFPRFSKACLQLSRPRLLTPGTVTVFVLKMHPVPPPRNLGLHLKQSLSSSSSSSYGFPVFQAIEKAGAPSWSTAPSPAWAHSLSYTHPGGPRCRTFTGPSQPRSKLLTMSCESRTAYGLSSYSIGL